MDSKIEKNSSDIALRVDALKKKGKRMQELLSQLPADAESRLAWLNDQLQP